MKNDLIINIVIKLKMEDNLIVCGDTEGIIKIIGMEKNDFVGDVKVWTGREAITGQVIMIEAERYDIAVFSLLREMFGLEFPTVLIATYERTGVWAGNATDSGVLILVAPPLLGWIVRFILTGHKNPLPWVANKEAV